MAGTNNVDDIASGKSSYDKVNQSLSDLFYYVWSKFSNAKIFIINILPRENYNKNCVVLKLNNYIGNLCKCHGMVFVDTEISNLFSNQSSIRDNRFFSNGYDNVHLNTTGYTRLAKYLKYLSHSYC